MFELIIRYTQQTSEDTWSLRHRSFRSEIPGLEKEMAKISSSSGAHVVDVNKVETPKNKEDLKNSPATPVQQAHCAISAANKYARDFKDKRPTPAMGFLAGVEWQKQHNA